MRACVRVN